MRLPVRHAERAFHVLSELLVRPLLRDEDVLRERDIIVEEIRSYRDDPGQYVFDLFDRSFYGDTPLGREIAGDEASVSTVDGPAHPRILGDGIPALQHGRGRRGDLAHERIRGARRAPGFGTGAGAPEPVAARDRPHPATA